MVQIPTEIDRTGRRQLRANLPGAPGTDPIKHSDSGTTTDTGGNTYDTMEQSGTMLSHAKAITLQRTPEDPEPKPSQARARTQC